MWLRLVVPDQARSKYSGTSVRACTNCRQRPTDAMHHSDPPSTTSGHGSRPVVKSKVTPAAAGCALEFRLQPDYHWTRSLSERVRGMRDSALGVVWKKRREQKLRGMQTPNPDVAP